MNADQIISMVADTFGLAVEDLTGPHRDDHSVTARGAAMLLIRQAGEVSFPRIGLLFGRRDHTTVMHSIRRLQARMAEDSALAATVEHLGQAARSGEWDGLGNRAEAARLARAAGDALRRALIRAAEDNPVLFVHGIAAVLKSCAGGAR